ncbi:MAG: Hpt domain-containing protein [Polyangiaceae bacterium]
MTFSIDDVRDSFERDIRAMLATGRSSHARVAAELTTPSRVAAAVGDAVAGLVRVFHSVHGTTALVGASSLSSAAEALESAASELREDIDAIDKHSVAVLSRLDVLRQGLGVLESALEHELAGERAVANSEAARFVRDIGRAPAAPASEASSAQHLDDAAAAELRAVFEEEATALLEQLESQLGAYVAQPGENAVRALERTLHTMKGAAATVGQVRASAIAEEARAVIAAGALPHEAETDTVERLSLRARRAAAEIIEAVVPHLALRFAALAVDARTDPHTATVAPLSSSASASRSSSGVDRSTPHGLQIQAALRGVFLDELRGARASVNETFASWARAPRSTAEPLAISLTLHQLKGAAATIGDGEVAGHLSAVRARIDKLVKESSAPTSHEVKVLAAEVAELLSGAEVRQGASADAARPPIGESPSFVAGSAIAERVFRDEATEVLERGQKLAALLHGTTAEEKRSAHRELARLFHRLRGSMTFNGGESLDRAALALQRDAEAGVLDMDRLDRGIRQIASTLGLSLRPVDVSSAAPASNSGGSSEVVRARVTVDPQLKEVVESEVREILESVDAAVLALEKSTHPRETLASLYRYIHTLKGALNTAGLTPTGAMLHAVEEMFETLSARPTLPPLKAVTRLLVYIQNEVRRQLRQADKGEVVAPVAHVAARVARVLSAQPTDSPSDAGVDPLSSDFRDPSYASQEHSHASLDTLGIRVSAKRLDALMNLAGELVVLRSRLLGRNDALAGLQRGLTEGRSRLANVVDEFRGRNEFSLIGRAKLQPAAPSAGFSELELDTYDDVNMFSRRVAEIADDANEVAKDLQGELVQLGADAESLGGVIGGIQREVMAARMVSVDHLFGRLRMPVRDAADREGREVRVDVRGGDVSVDKTVAEALFAPLLHIVRNAVAHGIEAPAARERVGKPREGVITLSAQEDGGQVILEISDDGRGLDLDALLGVGIERGLLPAGTRPDDPSVAEMVFAAGVSTRAVADSVSGRGMGGDVVRRTIQRLNGRVQVATSRGDAARAAGARTGTRFTITLPVSLAISKVLILSVEGRLFAVPLHFAERAVAARDAALMESAGQRRLITQDGLLAVVDLRSTLGLSVPTTRDASALVVLRFGSSRLAIEVDHVIAQEETVIKELGELFTQHPAFSGITLRGSGELVLLLDVASIFEKYGAKGRDEAAPPAVDSEERPLPEAPRPARDAIAVLPAGAQIVAPERVEVRGPTRVLFVDDSLSVRKVAERILSELDVEATLATDGEDALAKLRARPFDIVFTDLEMPRVNGLELLRELRFIPAYRDLPVVVVSSRSGGKHQAEAFEAGATQYLTKPFAKDQIRDAIEAHAKVKLLVRPRSGGPA